MAKKIKTLFDTLIIFASVLAQLEAHGVDIDRLITISNAQGPQAKVLKDLLQAGVQSASTASEFDAGVSHAAKQLNAKPSRKRSSSKH
jgi:hypothetical protein